MSFLSLIQNASKTVGTLLSNPFVQEVGVGLVSNAFRPTVQGQANAVVVTPLQKSPEPDAGWNQKNITAQEVFDKANEVANPKSNTILYIGLGLALIFLLKKK